MGEIYLKIFYGTTFSYNTRDLILVTICQFLKPIHRKGLLDSVLYIGCISAVYRLSLEGFSCNSMFGRYRQSIWTVLVWLWSVSYCSVAVWPAVAGSTDCILMFLCVTWHIHTLIYMAAVCCWWLCSILQCGCVTCCSWQYGLYTDVPLCHMTHTHTDIYGCCILLMAISLLQCGCVTYCSW